MLPYINRPFESLGAALGASTDELKLIFSFLLSYPLAGILKRIPDNKPQFKNLFIIGVSLFYLVGLFDLWTGIRTLFISSSAAYLIARYVSGPFMPWIGFVFLMGHMSINHIHRHIINDPSLVDITGPQMVLVMKLTAFCWNVHDGRLSPDLLDGFQKERSLKETPDLISYTAYVLFFPSLLAGPAFDYVEYQRWLETSMFDLPPGTDPLKAPPTRKKRRIPRSGIPALIKAVSGLVWLFAFLKFSGWYAPELLLSDEYVKYSFLGRVFLLHMVCFATRMKYYAVWSLAEGSCILSGIGYKGIDPKTNRVNWDRLQNVNPLGIELAQNSRAFLGNWNINTNNWLRNYMYLRVTPRGRKPGFRASLATFVTSAFWHGFEPGYYLAFVLAAFVQTVAKNCRRLIRPYFMSADDGKTPTRWKPYYDVASWTVTQLAFSFTVAPFILLSFDASLKLWSRVYFYCVIGVAVALAAFSGPSPVRRFLKSNIDARSKAHAEKEEAEAAARITQLSRSSSVQDGSPVIGLPDDPGQDLDEIMDEIRREVELRRRKGMSVGQGLQEVVQERLKKDAAAAAASSGVKARPNGVS